MPMRRTVRALSATALTATVLGTAAVAAAANPTAEVSPRTVAPGGTVTVSVSCEPTGGPAAKTIEATSQAFEHGTVELHRTAGKEDTGVKEDTGEDTGVAEETGEDTGVTEETGEDTGAKEDAWEKADDWGNEEARGKDEGRGGPAYSGTARIAPAANFEDGGPDGAGKTSEWSVEGECPAAPGGQGKRWSASFTVTREKSRDHSRGTELEHGVHAGEGGTFTDSTIALVTGGVLIAGAVGAAVHRLRRRDPSSNS